MWKAARVTADFAQHIQTNAGTLVKTFDVSNPTEPADADIICATSGDFSITASPDTEDFFEDVNNVPNNTMEGKRITGWNCALSVSALDITPATLKLAIGAADITSDTVTIRDQYKLADFQKIYWIGDMIDEEKVLVVEMDNVVSTGGLNLTTTKNGKGSLDLELTVHSSIADITRIPMKIYILTKQNTAYTYTAVQNPTGNPSTSGYYELPETDHYVPSTDTEVDEDKTYYTRS